MKKAHKHSHHRFAGNTQPSLRNGLRLLRALPGDQVFLTPSLDGQEVRQVDADLEASGPHDLAVRA
jgi:hypothetical protein